MSRHLVLLLAILAAGCADPVHDDRVAALGPEDPSVPTGPLHRPGQPCLGCHDGTGPASMVLEAGGTAYQDDTHATPLVAAQVTLIDANQAHVATTTNCAGNFFFQAVDWQPVYPVHAVLSFGGATETMVQHIGRTGSCADCHTGKDTPTSVVHIYLTTDPMTFPPSGCK